MRMIEVTIAEPKEYEGCKVLLNPGVIAGIVDLTEFGHREVSFAGNNSTYRVQESYVELKAALASI